jgi:Sulfite exporter TauE/SafE.
MTRLLCIFLIIFAIQKLRGKLILPQTKATVIAGGGITGIINGLLGISGPLSSAVFLTLGLTPVAYIATEATSAVVMHIIKIIVYGKLNLVNTDILLNGLFIGASMMIGNYLAIYCIKKINKNLYQKIVALVMIFMSVWLFFTVK